MANWIEPTESDLAASLSQGEIDAFRQDASLDGSDPVARLLARTVAMVSMGFSRQEYWTGLPLPSPLATKLTLI